MGSWSSLLLGCCPGLRAQLFQFYAESNHRRVFDKRSWGRLQFQSFTFWRASCPVWATLLLFWKRPEASVDSCTPRTESIPHGALYPSFQAPKSFHQSTLHPMIHSAYSHYLKNSCYSKNHAFKPLSTSVTAPTTQISVSVTTLAFRATPS